MMYGIRLSEVKLYPSSASLFGGIDVGGMASMDASTGAQKLTLISQTTKLRIPAPGIGDLLIGQVVSASGAGSTYNAARGQAFSISDSHLPLSIHAIEKIEKIRQGRDLQFKVNVQATFLTERPPAGPEITVFYGDAEVPVARSTWVEKFLPTWGYQDLEIWEVRALASKPHSSLDREYARLRKAVQYLDMGNWDASYKECREAVDLLLARMKELGPSAVDKELVGRLKHFLSLALHLETAPDSDWVPQRQDAVMAVTMTKALLDKQSSLLSAST